MKINACPRDRIGSSILKTGTYDTVLLESLSRLINPGEICLDIGANHGLMTSLMAKSSGLKGEVIAFEPHPVIFKKLEECGVHIAENLLQIGVKAKEVLG